MKKLQTILISVSAVLLVCVCVLLAILWRGEYCRVTFVCESGCEHTAWFHKGEVATADVVARDHATEHKVEEAIYLVYEDEEHIQYYFETPLVNNRETLFIKTSLDGKYGAQLFHFHTPHGDVMVAITKEEALATNDHGAELIKARFYAAYEKLGGNREEELKYTYRFPATNEWATTDYPSDGEMSRDPFQMLSSYYLVHWYHVIGVSSDYRYVVEEILVTTQPDWANN